MESISISTAKTLVSTKTVTRAVVECFDGRRWAIVLKGRGEFVLRSARQNPKAFSKLETAILELQDLGLRHAEIDFTKWHRDQETLT
jgi:hypothetical protein